MLGINGGELIVIILIAIVVVGPERMPEYARQLREWVLGVRATVDKGRAQLKSEVGDDVDWEKLDPRQYDPRRIVREALYEPAPASSRAPQNAPAAPGQPAPFDADAT